MRVLVTGAAGFIGFHLTKKLLDLGYAVVGVDNLNNYYDPILKKRRLLLLKSHSKKKNFIFLKKNIEKKNTFKEIFKKYKFNLVVHLAAQAGIRYSLVNPERYIKTNILGFFYLIENLKNKKTNLIFASSSSVYGNTKEKIFKEDINCSTPKQLYASTKLSNELMAYTYYDLFKLKVVGLRFFTVYGPFGRPDMSIFKFTEKILKNKKINLYNYGKHSRDFTYIDDIINGILKVISRLKTIKHPSFEIFNFGNNNPVKLKYLIKLLSKNLKLKPKINYLKKQKGDMLSTQASIKKAKSLLNYVTKTNIKEGIKKFVIWYKDFYLD